MQGIRQDREVAFQQGLPLFGDLLALAFERGFGLQDLVDEVLGGVVSDLANGGLRRGYVHRDGRAAFRAELGDRLQLNPTCLTNPHELGAAFFADFRTQIVFVLASWAFHSDILRQAGCAKVARIESNGECWPASVAGTHTPLQSLRWVGATRDQREQTKLPCSIPLSSYGELLVSC